MCKGVKGMKNTNLKVQKLQQQQKLINLQLNQVRIQNQNSSLPSDSQMLPT